MEHVDASDLEYAGFWLRVWATLIDTLVIGLFIWPILSFVYGPEYWSDTAFIKGPVDFLMSWVAPAIAVVVFWVTKQATPGKMAISARIVDAQTGRHASTGQLIKRYLGYYLATIPLGLGLIWVAFDGRKQGWHDKFAGTVVVRKKAGATQAVQFSPNQQETQ
jgi:uncharacterized RDD family membrane protein YckC